MGVARVGVAAAEVEAVGEGQTVLMCLMRDGVVGEILPGMPPPLRERELSPLHRVNTPGSPRLLREFERGQPIGVVSADKSKLLPS